MTELHRSLRAGILAGVCLSVLVVAYSIYRYPSIVTPASAAVFLPVFCAGVLWYGFAAVRWTRINTREDFVVLSLGGRWGIAIGIAWTLEVAGGNLIMPHELGARIGGTAAVVAAAMPLAAGAIGAARTGQIGTGARIGFWSGVVSGIITFLALAATGYLVVNVPGFPGVETPRGVSRALTADELAAFNIGDYLAGGMSHLFIAGALFGTVAGGCGGALGRAFRAECKLDG